MPDAHMDAIEPFALEEMKAFSTAYLPGFMADRYDVEAQTAFERAKTRIENTTASALHSTICGYTDYHTLQEEVRVAPPQAHYALLPVWMLHTKWKGRDFLFAMNGQTGKLIEDAHRQGTARCIVCGHQPAADAGAGFAAVVKGALTMHKKSWASRFLAVFLIVCLGLALPAAAAGGSVRDEYGLFDAAALSALEQTASTAADGHDCAVYYVTCANVGSQTAREYAKDDIIQP